jgi:hypothetical protein
MIFFTVAQSNPGGSIHRMGSWETGEFPPLFATKQEANNWKESHDSFLLKKGEIVELHFNSITKVEAAAVAFANAFTAEKEDAAEVEKTVHALIEKIKSVNLSFL